MNEIIIRYQDKPSGCKAVTATDENGDYNIYINSKLGIMEQEKAKQHELSHINKNHFYSLKSAVSCETEV